MAPMAWDEGQGLGRQVKPGGKGGELVLSLTRTIVNGIEGLEVKLTHQPITRRSDFLSE